MIDTIATLPDAACKDAHPIDTVKRIKGILSDHGIETVEIWSESEVPHCYSLRVNILGTNIGSNGKGVTKEFALASSYGELSERLQLGLIWKNKLQVEGGASSSEAQSKLLPAEQLLRRNFNWYTAYARELKKTTGVVMTEEDILRQYTDSDELVQATPYYCATTHSVEYLPTALCRDLYGSNGGAAGNTMEEAIVQAISEIVERNYKLRILSENIAVPEIPEDRLRQCRIAWKIIEYLKENGFRVNVKDCSLGTKFPVVCVCIINTATGKYHTHFGAFPDFEIALQRTLTESFQGRNIHNVTIHENFSYGQHHAFDMQHLVPELVRGTSEKTPEFFFRIPDEPYRPNTFFAAKTNRERLAECIAFFRQQGYDVLVRDCSCLGFPTCQVIIPGYSESVPHRLSPKHHDNRYSTYVSRVLRNPAAAGIEDLMGLMMHITHRSSLNVPLLDGFFKEAGIPAILPSGGESYLMNVSLAFAYCALGKVKETVEFINKALRNAEPADAEHLLCIKRYLSMKQAGYDSQQIRTTLEYFHKPQTLSALYADLSEKKNPLHHFVLHCDMQCGPDCQLLSCCKKKQTNALMRLVYTKSKELDQSALDLLMGDM